MIELNDIYIKVFMDVQINTKIGAKRIKDELEYVAQDISTLGFISHLEKEKNKFDANVANIIDERCYNFLES